MQFEACKYGIFQPNQMGGVKPHSTEDAGVFITHAVRHGWTKGLKSSVVAFDLAQFFPSLNHDVICELMALAGFPARVVAFFRSYLVGRRTRYAWNGSFSEYFLASVEAGQGSALSPFVSALYLALILHEFQERTNAGKGDLLSYVDDGSLLVRTKTWERNLQLLIEGYAFILKRVTAIGLTLEHSKTEVYHWTRSNDTLQFWSALMLGLWLSPFS